MKNVILIIGSNKDPVMNFFASKLPEQERQNYRWVNEDAFGSNIQIDDQKWYLHDGVMVEHTSVIAVWNRLLSSNNEKSKKRVSDFANYLLDYIYPCVLNRPMHSMSNHAKQYQMNLLRTSRLKKIDSYILANAKLRKDGEKKPLIFKSMSGVRSVVQRVPGGGKTWYVKEPVLFQPCIQGLNIRVHVVGKKVIACCCVSDAVDYRYGKKTVIKPYVLPSIIEQECIGLNQQLSLFFTGIDLIREGGDYYLLEVNPAPGYAVFDIDGRITEALRGFFSRCVSGQ